MSERKPRSLIYSMANGLKKAFGSGKPMGVRLYVFLFMFVIMMVSTIFIVLLLTGQISSGKRNAEKFIEKEFAGFRQTMTEKCGEITVQLASLSQTLSRNIENQLLDKKIYVRELQDYPEVLEEILESELGVLEFAVEKSRYSGVFVVLDATVNPALPGAEHSRAGLYIRKSEPQVSVAPAEIWFYYRGFPMIAYKNGLDMQAVWDMEFNVEGRAFFHLPLEKSRETALPMSRLYYWSMENIIPELGEAIIVCSIPLLDSDGNAFGVCGFEMSAWNFGSRYAPDNSDYKELFSMFGRAEDDSLDTKSALFAGHSSAVSSVRGGGLSLTQRGRDLHTYLLESGKMYLGLHGEIRMYPYDSPFAGERFVASLLIEKDILEEVQRRENRPLIYICLALLLFCVAVSVFIGKRYLNPITSAIDAVHSDDLESIASTNIPEIDQLIEKIKELRANDRQLPGDLFDDFIGRMKTLTPTELKNFDLCNWLKTQNDLLGNKSILTIDDFRFKLRGGYVSLSNA